MKLPKTLLMVAFILLIKSNCFAEQINPIAGTWEIDKEKTFQGIDNDPLIPNDKKQWVKNSVHRRNLIINDQSITTEIRGDSYKSEYSIIEKNDSFVKILFGQGKCEKEMTFFLDGQFIYTKADLEEYKEYYVKYEKSKIHECVPLLEEEAFEIANNYATKLGFNLNHFEKKSGKYKEATCEWHFFYEGLPYTNPKTGEKLYAFDDCFSVFVDSIYKDSTISVCP